MPPPFTLVQLETFAALARLQSFTSVARELYLTQPAVTQQIRTLERHFGVRLVDIVGRRPVLTDAGRFLASRSAEILAGAGALQREMREYASTEVGELALGATLTIGAYALPSLLARFKDSNPGITIVVDIENTETIATRVASDVLRLALVEGPIEDDRFEVLPFADDQLRLVVPAGHPLADRGSVTPDELRGEPFVWRERGSGTRSLAESALRHLGIEPPIALELPTGEGVARAVEHGLGMAILSEMVVERALAAGRLMSPTVEGLDLHRTFRIIYLRHRTMSPAARSFIELALSTRTPPQT